MASVGWRAGNALNANGAQQSPGNGIYVSDTGAPGTVPEHGHGDELDPDHRPADPGPYRADRAGHRHRPDAESADRLRARPGRSRVQRRRARARCGGRGGWPRLQRLPQRHLGVDGLWRELEATRGIDDDRQRHHQRLGARTADLQGPARDLLLPGHSGLVQPLDLARPDAGNRRRRADAGRPRPRGDLDQRPGDVSAGRPRRQRAGSVHRGRALLRRRHLHDPERHQRPAGVPGGRRARLHDAPRPARVALGPRRRRRGDARRRQRRRRLQAARRFRR